MTTVQSDFRGSRRSEHFSSELADSDARGGEFRKAMAAVFDEQAFGPGAASKRSMNRSAAIGACEPIVSVDLTELHEGAYSMIDASQTLLLTHVLRHSACSLQWRDSQGRSFEVEPGGFVVLEGSPGQTVQLAGVDGEGSCECVNVALRLTLTSRTVIAMAAHDFPFCNSEQACVRVILGHYGDMCSNVSAPIRHISVYDIDIAPAAVFDVPVSPDRWSVAIVTSGELCVGDRVLGRSAAAVFCGREPWARVGTSAGVSLLWLDLPQAGVAIEALSDAT